MTNTLNQSVIYNVNWEYGDGFAGFIIDQDIEGWMLLNYIDTDLTLNGFYIFHKDVIVSLNELDKSHVFSKLQRAIGFDANKPSICHGSINMAINQIALQWKVVGIYTKSQGYDELEIGVICNVLENSFYYHFVSTEGVVDTKISEIKFDDILVLSFGGRYEIGLRQIIEYDKKLLSEAT